MTRITHVYAGLLRAGMISTERFKRSNMSMGAYLWSGGPTLFDWTRA